MAGQKYHKPTQFLMKDMVKELNVGPRDILTRQQVMTWFRDRYPKLKSGTISAYLIRMSTNAHSRVHYSHKPEDDLFFQLDSGRLRLYDAATDPAPIRAGSKSEISTPTFDGAGPDEEIDAQVRPTTEFAYESDLRNFLSKNLSLLEPGLSLYDDEGITGIEFPVGGRFIDILAVDRQKNLVVIELKVSRGYDRVVGQLLRYVAWIQKNLAEQGQKVRGMIACRELTEDLLLACSVVPGIELFEYELSMKLRRVDVEQGSNGAQTQPVA